MSKALLLPLPRTTTITHTPPLQSQTKMCTDTIYTWDRCTKVEIRHRICLYCKSLFAQFCICPKFSNTQARLLLTNSLDIEHTRLQIDDKPCPYIKHKSVQYDSMSCTCKTSRRSCNRSTWALRKDGDHSWIFEVDESGKTWSVGSSPEKERKKDVVGECEQEHDHRNHFKKL